MVREKTPPPAWATAVSSVTDLLFYDLGGGQKHVKLCWVINSKKIATGFYIFYLMSLYDDFSVSPPLSARQAYVHPMLFPGGCMGLSWIAWHLWLDVDDQTLRIP